MILDGGCRWETHVDGEVWFSWWLFHASWRPFESPSPSLFLPPHTFSLSFLLLLSLSHTLFGLTLHLHGCCQRALSLALQSVDLASWRWTVAIFPSGFIWDWSWLYRDFYRKTERGGDRDNMRKRNSVFANVLFWSPLGLYLLLCFQADKIEGSQPL